MLNGQTTVYGSDGKTYAVQTAGGHSYVDVAGLAVGQTLTFSYAYDVQSTDLAVSVFDVVGTAVGQYATLPLNYEGVKYGDMIGYTINKGAYATDPTTPPGTLYVNTDNTGGAIGVDAGVMEGDRNGQSDHLYTTFQGKTTDIGIVFTQATNVEVAFKAVLDDGKGTIVSGAYVISTAKGVTAGEYKINANGTTTLADVPGFSVTTPDAKPGQNSLWTIHYENEASGIKSFDFWVVGTPGSDAGTQIKVVDFNFEADRTDDLDNAAAVLLNSQVLGNIDEAQLNLQSTPDLTAAGMDVAWAYEGGSWLEVLEIDGSKMGAQDWTIVVDSSGDGLFGTGDATYTISHTDHSVHDANGNPVSLRDILSSPDADVQVNTGSTSYVVTNVDEIDWKPQ